VGEPAGDGCSDGLGVLADPAGEDEAVQTAEHRCVAGDRGSDGEVERLQGEPACLGPGVG
jgi:hypothetical protein